MTQKLYLCRWRRPGGVLAVWGPSFCQNGAARPGGGARWHTNLIRLNIRGSRTGTFIFDVFRKYMYEHGLLSSNKPSHRILR